MKVCMSLSVSTAARPGPFLYWFLSPFMFAVLGVLAHNISFMNISYTLLRYWVAIKENFAIRSTLKTIVICYPR